MHLVIHCAFIPFITLELSHERIKPIYTNTHHFICSRVTWTLAFPFAIICSQSTRPCHPKPYPPTLRLDSLGNWTLHCIRGNSSSAYIATLSPSLSLYLCNCLSFMFAHKRARFLIKTVTDTCSTMIEFYDSFIFCITWRDLYFVWIKHVDTQSTFHSVLFESRSIFLQCSIVNFLFNHLFSPFTCDAVSVALRIAMQHNLRVVWSRGRRGG